MFVLGYFDPGSASLLMQALVGGGAGLVVFGRYLWMTLLGRNAAANPSDHVAERSLANSARRKIDADTLTEALSGEFRFHAS